MASAGYVDERGGWIPLTGHREVVRGWVRVDVEDFERLNEFRWHLLRGYAARGLKPVPGVGVRKVLMHRELLGLEPGDERQADHINRDRLDNRRANLRIVTHAQNRQNVSSWRGSSSAHRGVSWDRRWRCWVAYGQADGARVHLGSFKDEAEAARVAAEFRAEHMPFSEDAEVAA